MVRSKDQRVNQKKPIKTGALGYLGAIKTCPISAFNNWAVLSDEQMSNGYPFSLLNDEQMSNKVGVEHQPDKLLPNNSSVKFEKKIAPIILHSTTLGPQSFKSWSRTRCQDSPCRLPTWWSSSRWRLQWPLGWRKPEKWLNMRKGSEKNMVVCVRSARWWFQRFFMFTQILGEMIQID